MKKYSNSRSAFVSYRFLLGFVLFSAGFVLALMSLTARSPLSAQSPTGEANGNKFGSSYRNDVSPPLRTMPPWNEADRKGEHEANENPKIPHRHKDEADPVIQNRHSTNFSTLNAVAPNVAATLSNFEVSPSPASVAIARPPIPTARLEKHNTSRSLTKATKYSIKRPATPFWDLIVSRPSGPVSGAPVRLVATAIRLSFTTT